MISESMRFLAQPSETSPTLIMRCEKGGGMSSWKVEGFGRVARSCVGSSRS